MAVQIALHHQAFETGVSWRHRLPPLRGDRVVLRELRSSDAAALLAAFSAPDVSRFISAPPSDAAAFEQFISRSRAKRASGMLACYAVTLKGQDTPIGLFQIRALDSDFHAAEWGFALGSAFWGTGLFQEAAELVLAFAFGTIGVRRLEARVATKNGRGNRALQKLGAVAEGVLREAFLCDGELADQIVYGMADVDWRRSRARGRTPRLQYVH